MVRLRAWLGALALGAAAGAGTYAWLVADVVFAVVLACFVALGMALTVRNYALVGRPDDWETARWSGAFGGVVSLAMLVGLSPSLPVPAELRLALGLFVGSVALTAMNLGLAAGLESRNERGTEEPTGETTDATDTA